MLSTSYAEYYGGSTGGSGGGPVSVNLQPVLDGIADLRNRLTQTNLKIVGPPFDGGTLTLVQNKDYTQTNQNVLAIPLLHVAGLETADEALLSLFDCRQNVVLAGRIPGQVVDNSAEFEISGGQLSYPHGTRYKFMVELRHESEFQAVLIGDHVLVQDIATG